MLTRRAAFSFGQGQLQRSDQYAPCLARFDNIVDQAASGGDIRVVELRFILFNQLLLAFVGIVSRLDFAPEKDVDRPFSAHHGDLGIGPCVKQISAQPFAAHDAVGSAVALTQYDHELGDGGLAVGIDQARPIADDAAEFLFFARKESWDILQGYDRHIVGVADAYEMGGLNRGFNVNDARQDQRLVGHNAYDIAVQSRKTDDDVFSPQLVNLKETAVVDNG